MKKGMGYELNGKECGIDLATNMGWGRLKWAWIWEVKMERNMNKTGDGNWNEINM